MKKLKVAPVVFTAIGVLMLATGGAVDVRAQAAEGSAGDWVNPDGAGAVSSGPSTGAPGIGGQGSPTFTDGLPTIDWEGIGQGSPTFTDGLPTIDWEGIGQGISQGIEQGIGQYEDLINSQVPITQGINPEWGTIGNMIGGTVGSVIEGNGVFVTVDQIGNQVLTQAGRQILGNIQNQLPSGAGPLIQMLPSGEQILTQAGGQLFSAISSQVDLGAIGTISPELTTILDAGQTVLTTAGVQILDGIQNGALDISQIPELQNLDLGSVTSVLGGGITAITEAGAAALSQIDLSAIPGISELQGLDLGIADLGSIQLPSIPGLSLPAGLNLGAIDIGAIPGAALGVDMGQLVSALPGGIQGIAGGVIGGVIGGGAGGAAGAVGGFSGGGGIPVSDGFVGANTARIAATVQNQLSVMQQIKSVDSQTLQAVGSAGQQTLESIFGEQQLAFLKDGGEFLGQLAETAATICEFSICEDGEVASQQPLTDYEVTRENIDKELFVAEGASETEIQARAALREVARRNSAINAYSLALISRSDTANSPYLVQNLAGLVDYAGNLRNDVKAQSVILLALYQQQAKMLALQTAVSEQSAIDALGRTDSDGRRLNGLKARAMELRGQALRVLPVTGPSSEEPAGGPTTDTSPNGGVPEGAVPSATAQ